MTSQEVWMDVHDLARAGASIREIARRTGLARTTVRRLLRQSAPKPYGPRRPRPTKLEPFVAALEAALAARPHAPATRLFDQLRGLGYAGAYEAVKRWVRAVRQQERARRRACVRFETEPGLEAQFDGKGPVRGLLADEPDRPVHLFRFVLAYSRWRITLAVPSLELPLTLWALQRAFEQLGGVPRRLVFDNARTAVLKPRPNLILQPVFADFCRHYGCEPAPAWPYHPQRKGKTERSLRGLVDTGVLDRAYPGFAALQVELEAQDEAYHQRVQATTGQLPAERLEAERPHLLALPAGPFDPRLAETRRVLSDCTVSFGGARYSVPFRLVGAMVTVKLDPWGHQLAIYAGSELVAAHDAVARGLCSVIEEHVAELRRPRFDRLRPLRRPAPPPREPETRPLVAWPQIEVPRRPIEVYAAALGGAR
ncbi:MAG TPA: IS21 family transposase [Thermoanaerobaculia bacterium]|nr:IS21 family transposase [Thermoanaerobaculia bacterium]